MNKLGQGWSLDAIVAIIIFVVLIIVALWFLTFAVQNNRVEELKAEGETIPEVLEGDDPFGFIEGKQIDKDRLQEFADLPYDEIRKQLGIKGDFCIHLQDEDGNLINISPDRAAIGSGKARIGNFACS